MGTWSVSTSGENYIMEYSNGFKRSIRRSQVTKTSQGATVTYASSQSPNLVLATINAIISSYSSCVSKIDFTNNTGDDWNVDFFINPISEQLHSGVTIVDYDYSVQFWNGGTPTTLEDGTKNTDYSYNTSGNGAGVYDLKCQYSLSDSTHLTITKLIKVDGAGTILQSISINGSTVNSVSGLTINVTADIELTGYTGDIIFATFDGSNFTSIVNSGASDTANITAHLGDVIIFYTVDLDSSWSDYTGDFLSNSNIIIS